MNNRRSHWHFGAAALLIAAVAQGGISPQPFNESPLLGGSLGQTLRLTITGTGAGLCQATLGFRNQKGVPVPDDNRTRIVSLLEGQSAFHDLNFNALVTRLGQRYEARALVTYPAGQADGVCRWSAEIFDQFTKRTIVIFAFPPDPCRVQPSRQEADSCGDITPISGKTFLSPIGAAYGQTVRLGVVADSPEPAPPTGEPPAAPAACELECHLHSATGIIVASKVVKPAAGESDMLDLNMNGQVRFGERGVINPCCMPLGTGSGGGCKVSVQVFDQISGWTQSLVSR
jgi:hypothetical protein